MKLKSNPYLTVLTIVFGLLVLSLFLESRIFLYVCLVLAGLGILSLKFSKVIEYIWFKLAFALSQIIPNILLSLIFFLILTPIALLSKLFNVKSEFKSKNIDKSLFAETNRVYKKDSFERAW